MEKFNYQSQRITSFKGGLPDLITEDFFLNISLASKGKQNKSPCSSGRKQDLSREILAGKSPSSSTTPKKTLPTQVKDIVSPLAAETQKPESDLFKLYQDHSDLQMLGTGSYSRVYKCLDHSDGSHKAVKVILKAGPRCPRIEANILKKLSEKSLSVPRFYDFWEEGSKSVIKMEYSSEGTLQEEIARYQEQGLRYSEEQMLDFLDHSTTVLSELHSLGYAHMDFKPANILIRNKDTHVVASGAQDFKSFSPQNKRSDHFFETPSQFSGVSYLISDFGLATKTSLSEKEYQEGDHAYMPLETLDFGGTTETDLTKIDSFSLGLVLLEMMTLKRLPEKGDLWRELREKPEVAKILLEPYQYSESLKETVLSCLSAAPSKRPTPLDVRRIGWSLQKRNLRFFSNLKSNFDKKNRH